jgi:glycosyltransferase involved in cell wall biosynthesis
VLQQHINNARGFCDTMLHSLCPSHDGSSMTRILALGHSPLPFENTLQGYAPGKRTWQLVAPLLQQGHEICLVCARIPGTYPASVPAVTKQQKDNLLYYSMAADRFHQLSTLQQITQSFEPECVIGITTLPASVAAELNLPVPLWADLYGSIMAEAQVKAHVYQSDVYLRHFLAMEYKALIRADRFSTVSSRQLYALVGELGLVGRLNYMTTGEEMVHTIPAGGETTSFSHTRNVIRGKLASESDFVVLYSGGYNTWTDVNTLFYGLEKAMALNSDLVFVSTGGAIDGHDEETYPRFEQLIVQSPFRDRFHLCGWVDWNDVHNFYFESDVAIIADKVCYEALLGSRTRVLDWMRTALPTVTTPLSEVTSHLVDAGGGFGYPPSDADALQRLLVSLAENREICKQAGLRSRQILEESYTFEATTHPLQQWVQKPVFASDYKQPMQRLVAPSSTLVENFGAANTVGGSAVGDVSWFDVLQPVWQKLIHRLHRSPLAFLVRPLRKVSALVKGKQNRLYSVRFEDMQIPKQMAASRSLTAETRFSNTGRMRWMTDKQSQRPINLSYHWLKADRTLILRDGIRTPLTNDVEPNQDTTVNAKIRAPDQPGEYLLVIDLVHEHVGWFSDLGAEDYRVAVKVVSQE